jgi:hypothetical protein
MHEHLIQINDTLTDLNLEVMYSPIGMFRWQIQLAMEQVRTVSNVCKALEEGGPLRFDRA